MVLPNVICFNAREQLCEYALTFLRQTEVVYQQEGKWSTWAYSLVPQIY